MIAALAAGLIARHWAPTALRWGAVGLAIFSPSIATERTRGVGTAKFTA